MGNPQEMTEEMKKQYESSLRNIIAEEVDISVKKYVNGKIDNLTKSLDEYIKMDTKWKETAQPTINFATESAGFLKIGKYIVVGITAIGVFIVTLFKVVSIFK